MDSPHPLAPSPKSEGECRKVMMMDTGEDIKARIRRRKQAELMNLALDAMEVKPFPVNAHYTHVGTVRIDGKIIRYYGRMLGDYFVYDPVTRDVI